MDAKLQSKESTTRADEMPGLLLVDDHLQTLQSLQALLRINGYRVDLARSGGEALTKLQENRYVLMLLDLQMPGIGGLEVLEALQQIDTPMETLVISGDTAFASIKQAMRLGALDFIRKPYRPEELLASVSQALQHQEQKQRALKAERSRRASERMHRFIVNKSPDFIYLLDPQGRFTYVNDMAEELLGYKRKELLGRHFSTLIHPHNAAEVHNLFSEQRSGERAGHNVEIRLQVNRADDQVASLANNELIVELNASGIYKTNAAGEKTFVGTLGSARDVTVRKRSEERISQQAYYDLLTRLPNRALFNDRIKQAFAHARRHGKNFALLFMDLDHFKQINDTLGHVMGDRVLQQVAERIQDCLRAEDTLSRFGGDEFALLLPDISGRESVTSVAEKILRAVRQPFRVNNHELQLSLSLGIALYPVAGESQETLLQSADMAMYHVKAQGKDGFCFYSDVLANGSDYLSIERDMYAALDKQQFQVFFQPKVDPARHVIVGMEALLRWQHPQRGLLYPDEFLPAAEESKLIVSIGHWVLQEVCRELVHWRKQGLPMIKVSLNISPVQLDDDDFVEDFIHTLQEFKLEADQFEIDISEQGLARGQRKFLEQLKALRKFGVSVAIDDFGRGYSSLAYLRHVDVNTLKIDRWFIRDIEESGHHSSTRLVDGIALMAKGLHLNLVAEGVENRHQLKYVRDLGCQVVQGYLYGKAVPADAALDMMQTRGKDGAHFQLLH